MRKTGKKFVCSRPRTVDYRLWTYDIWGNAKDGYEVNDRYRQGIVALPKDATDDEVIACLQDNGDVKKGIRREFLEIEGESGHTIYITYKGRPEMELERVR